MSIRAYIDGVYVGELHDLSFLKHRLNIYGKSKPNYISFVIDNAQCVKKDAERNYSAFVK